MTRENDKSGWMIETANTEWWDGKQAGLNARFTKDPNGAIVFADKGSAERARCYLLEPIMHLLRSTEHLWPTAPAPSENG